MSDVNDRLERLTETKRQGANAALYADPLNRGVSVGWLAHVFRMDEKTVRKKLGNCPVKTQRRRGDKMKTTLYDLPTAASFLVTPAFSTAEYMRSVRRNELPASLQQAVWDALLKRQKWEENAGQLWRTDRVREVLGTMFQTIKFTMQLWVDTLEQDVGVTDEQRNAIIELVDALQKQIYDSLVENMGEMKSGPQTQEMMELVGESGTVGESITMVESEEDEIEQLI